MVEKITQVAVQETQKFSPRQLIKKIFMQVKNLNFVFDVSFAFLHKSEYKTYYSIIVRQTYVTEGSEPDFYSPLVLPQEKHFSTLLMQTSCS